MKTINRLFTTALMTVFASTSCGVSKATDKPRIGVLTLHGVGSQRQGSDFDSELRAAVKQVAGEQTTVVVKTVYYHGSSRERQRELWKIYDQLEDRSGHLLDHVIIRRLMLASVGDALAYANHQQALNSYYRRTHEKLRSAIDELQTELKDDDPVVVVAHSLGCKIAFDYLCDAQDGVGIWAGREPPDDFQQLANLRLLITTGCNLPFFESAVPASEHRFFRIPRDFQWINFYDRDDVLGWPLRELGGPFATIVQDKERNDVGSSFTAHIRYWKNDELNEEIADRILKLAE